MTKARFPGLLQSPLTDSNRRPPPYHAIQTAIGDSREAAAVSPDPDRLLVAAREARDDAAPFALAAAARRSRLAAARTPSARMRTPRLYGREVTSDAPSSDQTDLRTPHRLAAYALRSFELELPKHDAADLAGERLGQVGDELDAPRVGIS